MSSIKLFNKKRLTEDLVNVGDKVTIETDDTNIWNGLSGIVTSVDSDEMIGKDGEDWTTVNVDIDFPSADGTIKTVNQAFDRQNVKLESSDSETTEDDTPEEEAPEEDSEVDEPEIDDTDLTDEDSSVEVEENLKMKPSIREWLNDDLENQLINDGFELEVDDPNTIWAYQFPEGPLAQTEQDILNAENYNLSLVSDDELDNDPPELSDAFSSPDTEHPDYILKGKLKDLKNYGEEVLGDYPLLADYLCPYDQLSGYVDGEDKAVLEKMETSTTNLVEDENEPNDVYFKFLEKLRRSGRTNMFGAGPYLEDAFGLSQKDARKIVSEWMHRYKELSKKYNWNR